MPDLPPSFYSDLSAMGRSRMPAYLRLDAENRLVEWGGSLSVYGLRDLHRHQLIGEQVMFLEGLFPLDEPTFFLRWIETQPGRYADIYFWAMGNTVWIWLLNATPEATQHWQVQQRVNEAALDSP